MRKSFSKFCALAIAAAAFMSSCEKSEEFTVNKRTPQKMDFVQRVLPEDFHIGASLPAAAEAVDLGLSVKWANMNLGAVSADEFGDLYAWGEIAPSSFFGWQNYEFNDFHPCDSRTLYISKYCFDRYGERQDLESGGVTLDVYDDAAYLQWGDGWRMPSAAELEELCTKCKWTYSTQKSTFTVTGPNGNSIIIPYEGAGIGDSVYPCPECAVTGGLWSSTLSENESPFACQLTLQGLPDDKFEKGMNMGGANRCFGSYIRPVRK